MNIDNLEQLGNELSNVNIKRYESVSENRSFKDNSSIEEPLKNNINYQKTMEREALFKLDLQNEKDERAA